MPSVHRRLTAIIMLALLLGLTAIGRAELVAVMGIEDQRKQPVEADQALLAGLADVLALSLAQNGVPMIDRHTLGEAIGERRLNRLLGDVDRPLRKIALPPAAVLVQGKLADAPGNRLLLTLEATRGEDGTLLERISLEVDDASRLADALAQAARQLGERPSISPARAAAPQPVEGFTDQPEAGLLFYRGLEYLAANRHIEAVACFDTALMLDGGFVMASLWLHHALMRMGLADFAQAAIEYRPPALRQKLLEHRDSLETILPGRHLVIATAAGPDMQARADDLARRWAADSRVRVLTWGGVLGATAEQDVKLSGEFQHLPAVIDRWLFADVFVRVQADGVQALDVRTGKAIAQADLAQADDPQWIFQAYAPPSAGVHDAASSVDYASIQASVDPLGTNFMEAAGSVAGNHYEQEIGAIRRTAVLFHRALREPGNVSAWWAVGSLDRYWFTIPAMHRMLAIIDHHRDLPQAHAWASSASQRLYEMQFHGQQHLNNQPVHVVCENEPTAYQRHEKVLEWFPDSSSAWMVHYTHAMELADQGRRAEAVGLLRKLAGQLPSSERWLDVRLPDLDEIAINVYFNLAHQLTLAGELDEALQWMQACEERQKRHGDYCFIIGRLMITCDQTKATWTTESRPGHSHRQVYQSLAVLYQDMRHRIRELRLHLDKAVQGQVEVRAFINSNELFLASTRQLHVPTQFDLLGKAVTAWMDSRHLETNSYQRRSIPHDQLRRIALLRLLAANAADHQQVDALIQRALDLATSTAGPHASVVDAQAIHVLHMLAGREDLARQAIKQDLDHGGPHQFNSAVYRQIELDSLSLPPARQAASIVALLDRYYQDQLETISRDSGAYYKLIALMTPYLVERGQLKEASRFYQHIINDPDLPWFMRERTRFHQAIVQANAGQVSQATAQLREVMLLAATQSPDKQRVSSRSRRTYHEFSHVTPGTPGGLIYECGASLRRMRLYGGRVVTFPHAVLKFEYDPLPDLPHVNSRLYALMYLLAVTTKNPDWTGSNWWPDQGYIALMRMTGPQARPYLQRLLWSIPYGRQFDTRYPNETHWKSMMLDHWMGQPLQIDSEILLHWLVWHPTCEIKYYSASILGDRLPQSPRSLTILALTSAMFDGCRVAARMALNRVTTLEAPSAQALADLLDHPTLEARQYAAHILERGVGLGLERTSDQVLPDAYAVDVIRQWWNEHGRDRANWPGRYSRPLITAGSFNATARQWITIGGSPVAYVDGLDAAAPAVALDHGQVTHILRVCLSGDGKSAATYASDKQVRVWNLSKPQAPILTLKMEFMPQSLTLGASGKRLACTVNDRALVFDASTGRQTHELPLNRFYSYIQLLGTDDDWLILNQNNDADVNLYHLASHRYISHAPGSGAEFKYVQALPGDRLLSVGYDATIRVWQLPELKSVCIMEELFEYGSMAIASPDGSQVAVIDPLDQLAVWDAATGKRLMTLAKVEGSPARLDWPEASGPVLLYANHVMLRWDADLKAVHKAMLGPTAGPFQPDIQANPKITKDPACCTSDANR